MYIIGKEPRETIKAYVKYYLKYLSLNKRILEWFHKLRFLYAN